MDALELIGQVGATCLRKRFEAQKEPGVARFVLDQLTEPQCVAVVSAVRANAALRDEFLIRLPKKIFSGFGLPDDLLTEERSTFFRNSDVKQSALLLAFVGDDEGQSLRELTPVGAEDLRQEHDLWVSIGGAGLGISETHRQWWRQALKGMLDAHSVSLEQLAEYVLAVRKAIEDEGESLVTALGVALPALRIPKGALYFNSIPEKVRTHAHQWRALYQKAIQDRACYLKKQLPNAQVIPNEQLLQNWARVSDQVPADCHPTVQAFLEDGSGWNESSSALASIEYEQIKPLFDGLRRKERPKLGTQTLDFYEETQPDVLTDDEKDILQRLDSRINTEPSDEDRTFYSRHRMEMKGERSLKTQWEKFVYGKPLECTDFLVGLTQALDRLFAQAESTPGPRTLSIEAKHTIREVLELNRDAAMYFATRYRGLEQLFGPRVHWDLGRLMDFPELARSEKYRDSLKDSVARDALQIKFTLRLIFDGKPDEEYWQQLTWRFLPNTVLAEFHDDLDRLVQHPFAIFRAHRESVSQKGRLQYVDLADRTTFMAVYEKDRGSFVGVYEPQTKDLAKAWPQSLSEARAGGRISEAGYAQLQKQWQDFSSSYEAGLSGLLNNGLASDALLSQARSYENLIRTLLVDARGDKNRQELLDPVLTLGMTVVDGGPACAVVCPWHPLRLAAMAIKARQVASLLKHLLASVDINFGDSQFFFGDLASDLGHPYYPELAVGYHGKTPVLLAVSDTLADYSLLEPPIRGAAYDEANDNPKEAANRIVSLIKRYTALQPHEKANLSLVLYNCDSARLPHAAVEAISGLFEEEESIRCETHLRHGDAGKLRELYQKIIEASEESADLVAASEASRDFLAGLRVSIMADAPGEPSRLEGAPTDIVFLQDVVARHAEIKWESEPGDAVELSQLFPPRWSRRRPAARDEMRSVVYLTSPVQPIEGWTYLSAIRSLIEGEHVDPATDRKLPARVVTFRNNAVDQAFKEVHRLAQWVVNYDEILDRRFLRNQGVRVIRFKQSGTTSRNLVVSSGSSLSLLRVLLVNKLRDLGLGLSDKELNELAERMFSDANEISGDIVLRAAKKGVFASELIGVVLSRFLLQTELGKGSSCGWYFLDDYAEWLGQKEEQIADILAMSPSSIGEEKTLRLLVSESKYIGIANLAASRRESANQLRDTVQRLDDALFGDPGRLDRDLWLSRIGDLLVDGLDMPATEVDRLSEWRRDLRDGRMRILVKGYSHVFVPTAGDFPNPRESLSVPKTSCCFQEVFGRDEVKDLVLAYWKRDPDPTPIRKRLGDIEPWRSGEPRLPAVGTTWLATSSSTSPATKSAQGKPREETCAPAPVAASPQPNEPKEKAPEPDGELKSAGPVLAADDRWVSLQIGQMVRSMATPAADDTDEAWLSATVRNLQAALQSYSLQAKVVAKRLTPNAALVKLAGSDRLRVDDVEKRRKEILTTHGLNIISVGAEPGVVAIAVSRPDRRLVPLLSVWRDRKTERDKGGRSTSLVVGIREDNGELLYLSPGATHAPHTLIAGTTGSGKSVLMQNLILDIAASNAPKLAKILLIDPKAGVDYFALEKLPHLSNGIVIEREPALAALSDVVEQMDRRYKLYRQAGAKNLGEFNSKVSDSEKLPALWVVHDEFAEWMMVDEYRDHVVQLVGRLGVKARAAGIFLVFAAQRPDANVMPVQLRDNLGNRLILKVESKGTSEICLGSSAAEHLLGKGHLAARLEGESGIVYAQVPFLAEDDLQTLAQYCSGA